MNQAGTPFSLVQLRLILQRLSETGRPSYVITAETYVNGVLTYLAEYEWTCDGEYLNSTSGKAVEWIGENSVEASTHSIAVRALVPGYGEAFGLVTIYVTPIPEFSLLQVVFVSIVAITVVSTRVLSKRLSRRYG